MILRTLPWLLAADLACAAGGTALDAYNFVTGARAAGMGGAASAASADATALQWNPAGLARVSDFSATLSHLLWVAGIQYSYAGAAVPLPRLVPGLPVNATVGASVQVFNYGTIESTRGLADAVSASDLGFTLGGGLRFADALAGGASLKFFHHALAGAGVSEAAVDVGGAYEAVPGTLTLAAVAQNFGYSGRLEGRAAPLPSAVKAGFAFRFRATGEPLPVEGEERRWHPEVHVMTTGDVIAWQRGEPVAYNVGLEGELNGFLFARAGYQRPLKAAGGSAGLSFGAGAKVFGLRLDYAYGSMGDLGQAQFMTVSWSAAPRRVPAAAVAAAPPETSLAAVQAGADAAYREGVELYAAQRHEDARRKAAAAVAADPAHWQAWQLLGNCRLALGERADALDAYRRSLDLHPDNPTLRSFVDQLAPAAAPAP